MRVLSGIQPTGNLHIGNYLGSLKNWVNVQNNAESFFCIVDLHAITMPQDAKNLNLSIRKTAATYIACGIDITKSAIFTQSSVPEHSELAWLFNCVTPMGWLNRMTQFKEKAGKHKENAFVGLYDYPVLMAADILLYHPTHVPVGDDQKQHIEITRDIAGSFNRMFNVDYFKLPEHLFFGEATRIMSLRDGSKKMSKSELSDFSRINLTDNADEIRSKLQKAKSDALPISFDNITERPELENLATIFGAFTNKTKKEVILSYEGKGFSEFKKDIAEILIDKLVPIGREIIRLENEQGYLEQILRDGRDKARIVANKTIKEVQEIFGFLKI
jgi:tryptophanyl-tRNA synthetase